MIHDLVLPQLAMGMSEGTVVEWAVAEGGLIERDANLLSIETEKVVVDLPCPHRGWVHHVARVGDKLPVETLIARVADTEAEYRQLLAGAAPTAAPAAEPLSTKAETLSATASATAQRAAAAPTPATAQPVPACAVPASVLTQTHAVSAATAVSDRVKASGLARRIAAENSIDLRAIEGTGPNGRIVRRDLYQARRQPATSTAPTPAHAAVRARVPMAGMRRTIAERMVASKTTAAHTYALFEVEVDKLVAARETMLVREKALGGRISIVALYAKALALACRQVPICNATIVDDEIIVWDHVHIGIAVALPGATEFESRLMVPVLRHAERKGIQEIDREIKDLVDRARNNRLTRADVTDGTVTMSSTGGFLAGQWCVSTPLLNQPQVLNFQPGTPLKKPVVRGDDQIVVSHVLPCGLSFDHRAMDGEPAGRFVRALSELLSHPELMLV